MGGAYENESIFVYGYAGGILLMWMWAKREGQPPGNIRYRKRIRNDKGFSGEALAEAGVAFVEGTTVVNVLTGKKTRL